MISLVKFGGKWQKNAELGRSQGISYPGIDQKPKDNAHIQKGHFVIYTTDDRRFTLPLSYLGSKIFQQLLKMSKDEFGLSGDRPIRMPCDAVFMQHVVLVVRRGVPKDLEKALLDSIFSCRRNLNSDLRPGFISQDDILRGWIVCRKLTEACSPGHLQCILPSFSVTYWVPMTFQFSLCLNWSQRKVRPTACVGIPLITELPWTMQSVAASELDPWDTFYPPIFAEQGIASFRIWSGRVACPLYFLLS